MRMRFQSLVLGLGGVGSAALWRLAQRGISVVGIDRFAPPHDRGSSHGKTRILRQAYFEHPDYVPLARASYRLWDELEQAGGQPLRHNTGLVQFGPADGAVVRGVLTAAREHQLHVEQLESDQVRRRWPGFAADGLAAVYEPAAAALLVERCVAAQLTAARAAGAEIIMNAEVLGWSLGSPLVVNTTVGTFSADRLVVAAGPWAGPLLAETNVSVQVRRKVVAWYGAAEQLHAAAGYPCFLFELPTGVFYGFPAFDDQGAKVGEHSGGDDVADPLDVDRSLRVADAEPLDEFVRARLPGVHGARSGHSVCMYTMSPDEHFLVDALPSDPRIVFAAGLSGHGFKFAPALGEALAELALDGGSRLPIEFLSLRRFAAAQ
ncbi:MAG: N-methyl-L-tryptophan oxidase [Pirellulales bacterium]|nr:N-methyl-L-tryptophan oxidase [Pirellulales bacterium]